MVEVVLATVQQHFWLYEHFFPAQLPPPTHLLNILSTMLSD